MDCSIVPLRHKGLFTVSTTDFFYPLVEDPFIQGKIACANVLSDQYAMGIDICDNLLMILGASNDMKLEDRTIVTKKMIEGFNEQAKIAGTSVTGGQTVLNPWPIIGGVAMSTITEEEMIRPENARVGDLLILTKPLGTQVVVNLHQWLVSRPQRWEIVQKVIEREEAMEAYFKAIKSMMRLNRNGAKLMHKYKAHAATDVTGFGIMGHANNLAKNQKEKALCFLIDTLPIIAKMDIVEENQNHPFKLLKGLSAETSGGLLIAIPPENAELFIEEIQKLDNEPAWIIGRVVKNGHQENIAKFAEDIKIINY